MVMSKGIAKFFDQSELKHQSVEDIKMRKLHLEKGRKEEGRVVKINSGIWPVLILD